MPEPELYVIYTGNQKDIPPVISLSEEFFDGGDTAVDVKVSVIRESVSSSVIFPFLIIFSAVSMEIFCVVFFVAFSVASLAASFALLM